MNFDSDNNFYFARECQDRERMIRKEERSERLSASANGIPTVWNALSRIERTRIDRSTFYHILV